MKNKILIISILFIIITFSLTLSCFAGMDFTVTDELIENCNSISNGRDYIILTDNYTCYVLFLPTNVSRVYISNGRLYNYTDGTTNGLFDLYTANNNVLSDGGDGTSYDRISTFSFWYSTIDIMNGTTGDTVFFQKTPVTEQTTKPTILYPILEKTEMKEPIITTIVGLAKLLIPLLICLIGFWKAWQLLSKTLYKA